MWLADTIGQLGVIYGPTISLATVRWQKGRLSNLVSLSVGDILIRYRFNAVFLYRFCGWVYYRYKPVISLKNYDFVHVGLI